MKLRREIKLKVKLKQRIKLNLKLKKLQGLQAVETRKLPLIETQKEEAKIEGLKVVKTRKVTNP